MSTVFEEFEDPQGLQACLAVFYIGSNQPDSLLVFQGLKPLLSALLKNPLERISIFVEMG